MMRDLLHRWVIPVTCVLMLVFLLLFLATQSVLGSLIITSVILGG